MSGTKKLPRANLKVRRLCSHYLPINITDNWLMFKTENAFAAWPTSKLCANKKYTLTFPMWKLMTNLGQMCAFKKVHFNIS